MSERHGLRNSAYVRVISGDIPELLLKFSELGIVLYHLSWEDPLTVTATIEWKQFRRLCVCARRYGASVKLIEKFGIYLCMAKLLRRPVLVIGVIMVIFLTLWLPGRILLIEVHGNREVPVNRIIEQASLCGIRIGTPAEVIRSENMKNTLLSALPELQWAGINTYGSRAVISVREKPTMTDMPASSPVSSVVAVCDGIIQSCTATKGSLVCKPGQKVNEGDVLISGYTDCGLVIRVTRAEGEIFAETEHDITVIIPLQYRRQDGILEQETNVSVIIGKKRINLLKDSGILGKECVKMYREYPLTLPGGFRLPVVLAVEHTLSYDGSEHFLDIAWCQATASEYAQSYLHGNMISGSVLNSTGKFEQTDELLIFYGSFSCSEMIGRVREEGNTNFYGKND